LEEEVEAWTENVRSPVVEETSPTIGFQHGCFSPNLVEINTLLPSAPATVAEDVPGV
jgi:hypothetical protein